MNETEYKFRVEFSTPDSGDPERAIIYFPHSRVVTSEDFMSSTAGISRVIKARTGEDVHPELIETSPKVGEIAHDLCAMRVKLDDVLGEPNIFLMVINKQNRSTLPGVMRNLDVYAAEKQDELTEEHKALISEAIRQIRGVIF